MVHSEGPAESNGETAGSNDALDVAGYLLLARRRADLSQRELAARLGISQPSVARMEGGAGAVLLSTVEQVLRLGHLRLVVVDGDGRPVAPFTPDAVRDNAGRRFPAHLDVVPPDRRPANRGLGWRWDRAAPQGWYALRPTRDAGSATGGERPTGHPTLDELAARRRERTARPSRVSPTDLTSPCTCLDGCTGRPACPPECPCQCEPASAFRAHSG